VPKKEIIDLDVADKHHAPGILGNQGQGLSQGLYAGPTSAATHLLVPFLLSCLFPISYGIFKISNKITNARRKSQNIFFLTQIMRETFLV
jgi:hypothetical protein